MNMFEMKIEEVAFSHTVEVHISSGLGKVGIRAKYTEGDDYICITDSRYRTEPIYVHTKNIDLDLNERDNLKNYLFEWIISEEGTDFMRLIFDSKPPRVEK